MTADLRQLLADALPHAPRAKPTDPAFSIAVVLEEAEARRVEVHTSVIALLETLRTDAAYAIFRGHTQVVEDVGVGLSHTRLADWLLRRANAVGAAQAVSDLERYVGSDTIPFRAIAVVGGLKPSGPIDLEDGLRFLPWCDVPPSKKKQSVDDAPTFHRSLYDPVGALVREADLPRIHVPQTEVRNHLRFIDWSREKDTLLCLGLVGPTAPVLLAAWLEPPEWAPIMAGSFSMPFVEGPGRAQPLLEEAVSEASSLIVAWWCLSDERRDALRVPMQRLNSAMRRKAEVDSAIDLGVALESVFLTGQRGGLTFTLRVRVARWLGSTPEERRHLSQVAGDLYSVRSKAVHEGRVPDTIRGRQTRDLLEEGYRLTATALVLLISKGDPDWEAVTYG